MLNRRAFLATAGATLIAGSTRSFAQTSAAKTNRIVVVANRYHEADGLMAALCNRMARSPFLTTPYKIDWPRPTNPDPNAAPIDSEKPRCLIDVLGAPLDKTTLATVEIWCIDDLANTNGDSSAKAKAMEKITAYGTAPDGVVAFGTAGYPGLASNNGCATIGGTIFIHDASNDAVGDHGNWSWPGYMEALVPSKTPASFFESVAADQKTLAAINLEMITPLTHPASVLQLIIAPDAVGISSVNIPKNAPYCDIDTGAIVRARAAGATNITSVETTHGVIRSIWQETPFIYVTAIPNRVCHFPDEAQSMYAQEFPSSHNAGVALKHVLPFFAKAISQ
ncbi:MULTISPECIES: hypothetical protein [unclassified Mesorhizobium]|uniref:hypothetical protein n=1 Tax=unclassified Mesorhizobium TaxID=325217 RepID=UPI0010922BB3|nr:MULTISPECIES: hypothetical protein [unclassified Mesorhizobium]TGP89075.1 hypothetical protein EN861_27930 [Mesorhizobium sp. M8A.F.Ca.ET.218.01.1.1]TGT16238.1 hypothetical protein EN856_27465 [Mesorhizobium sp. M8A.F.Ca.ET.213.01.1.1]